MQNMQSGGARGLELRTSALEESAVEEETVCCGGELDRPLAEMAEPIITEEGHEGLSDQSPD